MKLTLIEILQKRKEYKDKLDKEKYDEDTIKMLLNTYDISLKLKENEKYPRIKK